MRPNILLAILVMALVTYMIRVIPLILLRKPIKNELFKSFLYYMPYVTLSVMTFPAIIHVTKSPISGMVALIVGLIAARCNKSLVIVAAYACISVYITELFI